MNLDKISVGTSNAWAGTTHETQTWQLKAGMNSTLDDIRNNHPQRLGRDGLFQLRILRLRLGRTRPGVGDVESGVVLPPDDDRRAR